MLINNKINEAKGKAPLRGLFPFFAQSFHKKERGE